MTTLTMPPYLTEFYLANYSQGLIYSNETFYAYRAGAWTAIDERADIERNLAIYFGNKATATGVSDAKKLLKAFLAVKGSILNADKHLLCLENGTLDTRTCALREHSPKDMLTNRNAIRFDESATCPRFQQFLEEVFAFDDDKDQKITFVQEWFGYSLVPDTTQQKFLWLVGDGGNGKSVLLAMLEKLVGTHNVSHAQLDTLGNDNVRAGLENKLLNISAEMSAESTLKDAYFKVIVAGESVDARRLYKDRYSFKPTARLVAATNFLPRLMDHTSGFARRAIILEFNRKFSQQERDPNLEATLEKELAGILIWSIEGLQRLRARGRFEVPTSSDRALAQYREESDLVAFYATQCLRQVDRGGIKPAELYLHFQPWCRDRGLSPLNIINFGKRLSALGFEQRRPGGVTQWMVEVRDEDDVIDGESRRLDALSGVLSPTGISPAGSQRRLSGYQL